MAGGMTGRAKAGRYKPLAEINVTPLVDVMLVLLIVFMVAAPLMTSGVTIDLPKASAQPLSQDAEPLTISVNAEGKVFLQETEVQVADLAAKLSALSDNKLDRRIFVRGDKGVAYGRIMEVMSAITQGGFTKVALLAEQTAGPATPPRAPAAPGTAGAPPQGAAPAVAVPVAPVPTVAVPARRPGR